jgi:hypothetical protein
MNLIGGIHWPRKRSGRQGYREEFVKKNNFQTAAARAEAKFSQAEWGAMSPKDRSDAIYRELRSLDEAADQKDLETSDDC